MLGQLDVVGPGREGAQDAAVVGAVGAVVEQGDVPTGAQHLKEVGQRPGRLGEEEGEEALGHTGGGAPADHGAHVDLGELVVSEVDDVVAGLLQVRHDLGALLAPGDTHAHEDAGGVGLGAGRGEAVVELGDRAGPQDRGEAQEGALLLGDGDPEDGLALLTDLAALGDVAQLVEVEVGAGQDEGEALAGQVVLGDVALEPRQGQGAGGLGDGAHVVEDVAHGGGGLVGGDGDDVVEQGPAHAEGLLTDAAHSHPFGKQTHMVQGDGLPAQQGGLEAGRLLVLDADDLDPGHELLDEDGDTGRQPAAAHGHEDAVEMGVLLDELQTDGALTGNDAGVVEGGDVGQALGLGQAGGLSLGRVEVVPVEADLAAQGANGVDLDLGGDGGHDDDGAHPQQGGGAGHALGVVAGRGGDDAALALGRAQGAHGVVGAADLEGVDGLEVLALDLDGVAQAGRQGRHLLQGRVLGRLVDGGLEDLPQVAGAVPGRSSVAADAVELIHE